MQAENIEQLLLRIARFFSDARRVISHAVPKSYGKPVEELAQSEEKPRLRSSGRDVGQDAVVGGQLHAAERQRRQNAVRLLANANGGNNAATGHSIDEVSTGAFDDL